MKAPASIQGHGIARVLGLAFSALMLTAACGSTDPAGEETGSAPCSEALDHLEACGLPPIEFGEDCAGADEIVALGCDDLNDALADSMKADGFLGLYDVSAGNGCKLNVQCADGLACIPFDATIPSPKICGRPRFEEEGGYCDSDGDCAPGHVCANETLLKNGQCMRTGDAPTFDGTPADSLTLMTYNAGLAYEAVALAEERRPLIIDTLEGADADVICLQEVWTDEDVEVFRAALEGSHPYAFAHLSEDTGGRSSPCGALDTLALNNCVSDNCDDQGISAEECVSTVCAEQYDALGEDCQRCLAANTSSPAGCALPTGAKSYAWGGRNGLLLLSRYPMTDIRYTEFESFVVRRSMLTVKVEGRDVHCTHLTSDLKVVPYPEDASFAGWSEEHQAELAVIDQVSASQSCPVLLGDLNTGPDYAGLRGELLDSWQALEGYGFVEPWTDRQCTWCSDNPLAGTDSEAQYDHILIDDCPSANLDYERVMDQPVTVNQLETRLSDHYGLRATVTYP